MTILSAINRVAVSIVVVVPDTSRSPNIVVVDAAVPIVTGTPDVRVAILIPLVESSVWILIGEFPAPPFA
jgi:hypothetical protein